MDTKEKDVAVEATSDVEISENVATEDSAPKKRMVTEEEFPELFEEIKLTPQLQEDLYKKSVAGFIGSLIRETVISGLFIGLLVMGFTADGFDKQVPFIVLAGMLIIFCSVNDLAMHYPYSDVQWFKDKNVQKAYMVMATNKGRSRKKKRLLIELDEMYFICVYNASTFHSIDKGEPVILLVRQDEYRVIGIDTLLGTHAKDEKLHEER